MNAKRCYGCMKLKTNSPVCEHCGFDETTANASHQLPLGTVLKEQYLIGKVLGQGGFGITYLGWDLYLDIPVAIKEYYPTGMVMRESTASLEVVGCGGDDGTRFRNNKERFLREAKMLARFSQVAEIVQIRNFFLANNTAYIVMEYVEGITLKQYVKNRGGKLSVEETLGLLTPVMEAMGKVHKAGLVHRDISPDNIMLLPRGGTKLLDFGAVRDVGAAATDKELTKSTEAILKQGYAPIEQYQKRGSLGPWTDVYALCATIHYCLIGEAPADAPERLLMEEPLELGEKVPELTTSQRDALEHGLALRTEQRTGSMQQLQEELLKKEENWPEPTPVPEPVPEEKPKPDPEKKPGHTKQKQPRMKQEIRTVSYQPRKTGEERQATDAVTIHASTKVEKAKIPEKESKAPARREKKKKKKSPLGMIVASVLVAAAAVLIAMLSGNEDISVPFVDKRITGSYGTSSTWSLDLDTGELVIGGSGSISDSAGWQEYRDQITSVVITEEISVIGPEAFAEMGALKTVTVGGNVKLIMEGAFRGSAVADVSFTPVNTGSEVDTAQVPPEPIYALTEIGKNAFQETALRTIVIPDSVVTLGSGAFAGCDELESVILWEHTVPSFASWETGVFQDVSENFTLHCVSNTPASEYADIMGIPVKYTAYAVWDVSGQCGDNLYYHIDPVAGFMKISGSGTMWDYRNDDGSGSWGNKGLAPWEEYREEIKTLVLCDGITALGEYAFAHCQSLKDIHWGNTLTIIPFQAFLSAGMVKVVLPDSVTQVEDFAFNWCYDLREIQLSENIRQLNEDAVAECKNLEQIWIGQNTQILSSWNATPFSASQDEENTTIYRDLTIFGLQNSYAEAFAEKYGYGFKIGARGLAAEAEGQCGDNAWWFHSGDTLVLYGTGATWKYNLSEEDITGWAKLEYNSGHAYRGHPKFWVEQAHIRHIQVLPGLTELGNGLFQDLYMLETVDLGTVTKCYAHFWNDSRLKEVVFPESVKTVGSWLFHNCSGLQTVIIEGNATVEEMAFERCYGLENVYFLGGREQIRGELFSEEANSNGTAMKSTLMLHVRQYSPAETYAKKYGLNYEIIE